MSPKIKIVNGLASPSPLEPGACYDSSRAAVLDASPYDVLVARGVLSREDLAAADRKARATKTDLGLILQRDHRVSRQDLRQAFSESYGCPLIEFSRQWAVNKAALEAVSPSYLRRHGWFPMDDDGETVSVLIDNPRNAYKNQDIRTIFQGRKVRLFLCLREDIACFIDAHAPEAGKDRRGDEQEVGDILDKLTSDQPAVASDDHEESVAAIDESDNSIIQLVNRIILDAYESGVSDIHIEPNSGSADTTVRFRVDGHCRLYQGVPAGFRRALVSRIKILAGLDIAERRVPQDGKIVFRIRNGGKLELRVATIPTVGAGNEDVIMRLLATGDPMPLDKLNLLPWNQEHFKKVLARPYGMILVVGPTGSGKTTTLHSALKHINVPSKKIWTAEDPVEITQAGLRQVHIQNKSGLTFATALRAFLRADPDVIMIGEMRDKETIDIALKAALTGHLVLSTMHTNSAVETVVRLLDMGVDPFTYSDALLGVLAQRLVRTLCSACKHGYEASTKASDEFREMYGKADFARLALPQAGPLTFYKAAGCEACGFTGYKGRTGLHEFLFVDEDLRKAIQGKSTVSKMLQTAKRQGMMTLLQDGLKKCLLGYTDISQVMATVSS